MIDVLNALGDHGLLKNFSDFRGSWKALTTCGLTIFGLAGIFIDTKDKVTNRVTWLGWVSFAGILLSGAVNLYVQRLDSEDERAKAEKANQLTKTQLQKLDESIEGVARILTPFVEPTLAIPTVHFHCPRENNEECAYFQGLGEGFYKEKKSGGIAASVRLSVFHGCQIPFHDPDATPSWAGNGVLPWSKVDFMTSEFPLQLGFNDGTVVSTRDLNHACVVIKGFGPEALAKPSNWPFPAKVNNGLSLAYPAWLRLRTAAGVEVFLELFAEKRIEQFGILYRIGFYRCGIARRFDSTQPPAIADFALRPCAT